MEIIGIGLIVCAASYFSAKYMEHNMPSYYDLESLKTRTWLHERIEDLEKEVHAILAEFEQNRKKDQ
jgi:hypothetical protein